MSSIRSIIVSGVLAIIGTTASLAQQRPPIGQFGSAPDAMIFYVAHGPEGACGPGCSDWIAAEGAVQWDTYKRLIAILDRQAEHKLPVVIHTSGTSNLKVASSLGRILRDHKLDATVGTTEATACAGKSDAECFALKRPGGPLDARGIESAVRFRLRAHFGGRGASQPAARYQGGLAGRSIRNRLAPNVSAEQRESLTEYFGEQHRKCLHEMGLAPDLVDIIDGIGEGGRPVIIPPTDWARLHIVTPPESR